jgi:hypothetical protein
MMAENAEKPQFRGLFLATSYGRQQEVVMTKSLISLSVAALGLAACTHEPVAPAPAPAPVVVVPAPVVTSPPVATVPPSGTVQVVPQTVPGQVVVVPAPTALRAGIGRIEAITSPSASAGGTVPVDETRRFNVRMEDGTVQYVDARAPNLALGDRVEITRDGHIRSPI